MNLTCDMSKGRKISDSYKGSYLQKDFRPIICQQLSIKFQPMNRLPSQGRLKRRGGERRGRGGGGGGVEPGRVILSVLLPHDMCVPKPPPF